MARQNVEGFRVFQPGYTDRNGKKRHSPRYHVAFKDQHGIKRRLPAFTDRSASISFGRKLRQLDDLCAVGESPRGDLAKWVDGLADEIRDKLIVWSILDQRASTASQSVLDHVEDWYDLMLAVGRTKEHAELYKARVTKIIKGCGFHRFSDIDELTVQHWISKNTGSAQTRNHYAAGLRAFCRWMVRHRRAIASPITNLTKANVETDRKRVRRALSIKQLRKLIQTAEDGPTRGRTTGHERALIYRTAIETGYRASEIRSLQANDLDLSNDPPTIRVNATAKGNKQKREARLALTSDLAAKLRLHLANKLPGALAFSMGRMTAAMLRFDLARAGIPYEDPETGEVFDFHSLRVQCATNLARANVHPALVQKRLRHCTMDLTMNVYTKLSDEDQAAAVEAMPKLSTGA